MNTFGLRPPGGEGTGETVYLIGPSTADVDDEVSVEINTTVSAEVEYSISAEVEYSEHEV